MRPTALTSASDFYQQVDPNRSQVLQTQATNLTKTQQAVDQNLAAQVTTQSVTTQSTGSAPSVSTAGYNSPEAIRILEKANNDAAKKWSEGKTDEANKILAKASTDAAKKEADYNKKHPSTSGPTVGTPVSADSSTVTAQKKDPKNSTTNCSATSADYKIHFEFVGGDTIDGFWCGGNTVDPNQFATLNGSQSGLSHVGSGGLHVSCSDTFYEDATSQPFAKKSDINTAVHTYYIAKMKNGQVDKSCGTPPPACQGPVNVQVVRSDVAGRPPFQGSVAYTTTVAGNSQSHPRPNGNAYGLGKFNCPTDAAATLTSVESGFHITEATDSGTMRDSSGLTLTLAVAQDCQADVAVQVIDTSKGPNTPATFAVDTQVSVNNAVYGIVTDPPGSSTGSTHQTFPDKPIGCGVPAQAFIAQQPSSSSVSATAVTGQLPAGYHPVSPFLASGTTPAGGGTLTLNLYVGKSPVTQCTGPLTIYVRDADNGSLVQVGGASATVNGSGHALDSDAVTAWPTQFTCGDGLTGTLVTPPTGYTKVIDQATAVARSEGAAMTFTVRQIQQDCRGPLTIEVRDSRNGQLVAKAGAQATYDGVTRNLSSTGTTAGGTYDCSKAIDGDLITPPPGYETVVGHDSVVIDRNGETLTFFVRPKQTVCEGPLTIEVVDTAGNHVGGGESFIQTPSASHDKKLTSSGVTADGNYDCGTRIDGTLTTPPNGYDVVSGSDSVLMDSNGETLRFVVRKQSTQVCVGQLTVEVRNSETGALVTGAGATATLDSAGKSSSLTLQSDGSTPFPGNWDCGTNWHGILKTPPAGYQIVVDEDSAVIDENGETLTFYVRQTPDQTCEGPLTIRVVDDNGALVQGGVVSVDGRLMEVTGGEIILPGQQCGQMTVVLTDWPDNTEALEPTIKTPTVTPEGALAEFVVVPANVGGVVIQKPSSPLPRTGSDLGGIALLALAVLGAGGLMVRLSRRRRPTA